jgi:hypothetical protein
MKGKFVMKSKMMICLALVLSGLNASTALPSGSDPVTFPSSSDPVPSGSDPVPSGSDPVTFPSSSDPVTFPSSSDPVMFPSSSDPFSSHAAASSGTVSLQCSGLDPQTIKILESIRVFVTE